MVVLVVMTGAWLLLSAVVVWGVDGGEGERSSLVGGEDGVEDMDISDGATIDSRSHMVVVAAVV